MRTQPQNAHQAPATPGYNGFSMEMKALASPAVSTAPLRRLERSLTPTREDFEDFKGERSSGSRRKILILDWSRIILSLLLIATGSAIVGCEGHALYTYNSTHLSNAWFLPLWPQHFDLRPSIGILVGGAVVIVASFVHLICAILPACSPRFFFLTLLSIISSFLGLAAAAFATGYSAKLYHQTGRDTIRSWTCRWYNGAVSDSTMKAAGTASTGNSGGITPPAGFEKLCFESHAAFDLTILNVILGVGAIGLSSAGYWLERKMS